jgi:hypothetical protein
LYTSESDVFEYRWFNPADGTYSEAKTAQGGNVRQFWTPESYPNIPEFKDWTLHIRKK